MKKIIASLLVLNLLSLPDGVISFTARPLGGGVTRAMKSAPTTASPHHPIQLHGLLPDFLTRNKSAETSTELALKPSDTAESEEEEEELSETKKLLQKVKQAGTAGAISYALWELAFWGVSIPVCVVGYKEVTGEWPDLSKSEDMEKVGAEAFAFVNFARLAVPLRIGLALSTTGWIDENVVQKYFKKDEESD